MWKDFQKNFQNFQKNFRKNFNSSESYISLALGILVVLVFGILVFNFVSNRVKTGRTTQQAAKVIQTPTATPEKKSAGQKSYKVQNGDTLWDIAEKTYNSGYKWVDVAKANNLVNPDHIEPGQVLSLPTLTAAKPSINGNGASVGAITGGSYTVVRGDNLWNISVRAYGDGFGWTKIAQRNGLVNPDLIHAGNVFVLPR